MTPTRLAVESTASWGPWVGWEHRVAEPVTGDREFNRHKRPGFPMEILDLAAIIVRASLEFGQDVIADDTRQKIIQNDILVMKSNALLYRLEAKSGVVIDHPIMKPEKKPL